MLFIDLLARISEANTLALAAVDRIEDGSFDTEEGREHICNLIYMLSEKLEATSKAAEKEIILK